MSLYGIVAEVCSYNMAYETISTSPQANLQGVYVGRCRHVSPALPPRAADLRKGRCRDLRLRIILLCPFLVLSPFCSLSVTVVLGWSLAG